MRQIVSAKRGNTLERHRYLFNKEKFRFEWDNWVRENKNKKKKVKNCLVALSEHVICWEWSSLNGVTDASVCICTFEFHPPTRTRDLIVILRSSFQNFDTRLFSSSLMLLWYHSVARGCNISIDKDYTLIHKSDVRRTLLISKWLLNHWYDFLACLLSFNFILKYFNILYSLHVLCNIYYIYEIVELHLFEPKSITNRMNTCWLNAFIWTWTPVIWISIILYFLLYL